MASGAFTIYPFRGNLAAHLRAETGRVLSRWGDAGWGQYVAEDKRAGHFRDELVDAMAERRLLDRGGIAVVGSRHASPEDLAFTTRLGAEAAVLGTVGDFRRRAGRG